MCCARFLARVAACVRVACSGKFSLWAANAYFVTLKTLIDEMAAPLNVETAVALVEGAARVLLRTPETRTRMDNMLEVCVCVGGGPGLGLGGGAGWTAVPPRSHVRRTCPMAR